MPLRFNLEKTRSSSGSNPHPPADGAGSEPKKLRLFQASQVRLNPTGIGADVTLAYARNRADIDSATRRRFGESHDHVILKTKPGGGVGRFNPQRLGIGGHDLPPHVF